MSSSNVSSIAVALCSKVGWYYNDFSSTDQALRALIVPKVKSQGARNDVRKLLVRVAVCWDQITFPKINLRQHELARRYETSRHRAPQFLQRQILPSSNGHRFG